MSMSQNNPHLFSCVISILTITYSTSITLSRIANKRDSIHTFGFLCTVISTSYYIIIIFLFNSSFYTKVTLSFFSLKSDGQQFSSGLQNHSEYSGRFKQCSNLDGFDSSFDVPFFQSLS